MTRLFIIHSHTDQTCADQLRHDLATHGYQLWQDTSGADPDSITYQRAWQHGIRGSRPILLLWSAAAQSAPLTAQLAYAQQLLKPILVLTTDRYALPDSLANAPVIAAAAPCTAAADQLRTHLPPPDQDDLLLTLLAHTSPRVRKQGVEHARLLLQSGERRDEVLALLSDVVANELMPGVRTAAQALLDATQPPRPASRPDYIFEGRCPSGHITWYDKHEWCRRTSVVRQPVEQAGKRISELYLPCGTAGCTETVIVRVDCEGYE